MLVLLLVYFGRAVMFLGRGPQVAEARLVAVVVVVAASLVLGDRRARRVHVGHHQFGPVLRRLSLAPVRVLTTRRLVQLLPGLPVVLVEPAPRL